MSCESSFSRYWGDDRLSPVCGSDGRIHVSVTTPVCGDGRDAVPGDWVWGEDGAKWQVIGVGVPSVYPYTVIGKRGRDVKPLKPEWLTHEEPDSWARLYRDIRDGDPVGVSGLADRAAALVRGHGGRDE